jgi:thiosulfate/3-mercaptopyruvate sulfurtransferase
MGVMVVDSRAPDEFKGLKMSRESDKLGHIPGATNLFFMAVLTGNFKEYASAAEIEKVFKSKNITPEKNVVFTCVSGCFGTSLYFAARLMGYDHASVYDGAWIEWSRRGYPVELSAVEK